MEEAVGRMKRDTRRFAKRQVTWLSGEAGAIRLGGKTPHETAAAEIRKFLL
jgi:tRNA A37 N6-isopentenylltransferase MiaA